VVHLLAPARQRPLSQVRRFAFLPRPLSVPGGELTPTLKLRRGRVTTIHAGLIDRMYGASGEAAAAFNVDVEAGARASKL
jgi:long-subunit acyl-CoA synthetase (AMP-forming)